MDMKFPRGRGTQVKKSRKFQGMGVGGYHEPPLNGKSWEVGVKLGKNLHRGLDIF